MNIFFSHKQEARIFHLSSISSDPSFVLLQTGEPADFEFSLRDAATQILLPYVHRHTGMHICYAYSSTEAVSSLFAIEYNLPPVELSTQQIVDQMPRKFNYAQRGRKRNKILGCYYGSHIDALYYARNFGLFEDSAYPKRKTSWDIDFPDPLPNEVKYQIGWITRVRTENIATEWHREGFEDLVTAEDINQVLLCQPMVGAIKVCNSFVCFKGEEVYMGSVGDEIAEERDGTHDGAHSVLVTGWGIKNGVEYFEIKNHWGVEWGDKGYGKIKRNLIYRLAYPEGIVQLGDIAKNKKEKYTPSSSETEKQKAH